MKNNIIIVLVILLQFNIQLFAQADYNLGIPINTGFSKSQKITPFSGQNVTAISITGDITFLSEKGFVRLIVSDNDGNEYLLYESYPMLAGGNQMEFEYECEESCFFDGFIPVYVEIQIENAELQLETIDYSDISYSNAEFLRKQSKFAKNTSKLSNVQNYIEENNLIWKAEETEFSKLSYANKAKLWGREYRSYGYEFFTLGFYSIKGPTESDQVLNHGYASNFDWRSRHNANQIESPYYDGDESGTGWMTPVVCQGKGCWLDGEFICNMSESECIAEGGDY